MSPEARSIYQARHPNSVLVTPEFPHCAAALNALFDGDMWERDEDVDNGMLSEEVDLSSDEALKNFRAGPAEKTSQRLRWRAPTETLRGPASLWKETHEVTPTETALMAALRAQRDDGAVDAEEAAKTPPPQSYTAYKLVFELDRLTDSDFQTITRLADRHNASMGVEAAGDKILLQLAFVR